MRLYEQLIKHEGLRLKPYRDTVGKLTIGVGRNLDDVGISEDEALQMLRNDITSIRTMLVHTFPWFQKLNGARRDVVANMVFNLGLGRFKRFRKLIAALIVHDYDRAAIEMMDSKWADQVGSRANELSYIMRRGK
ncbi:MAG: hypothetical protein J3T61_10405 [Candidatus Brocadiales bacterium]|nr:hypothetical protein [Candidatus Bathyanammoxibius sp.]